MASIARAALGGLFGCFLATTAAAQDLTIALAAAPTSADPHYHNLGPNNAQSRHIFDRLVDSDEKQRPIPGLAMSWRALDENVWEFKLRQGVKFHDGTPFTADDVVFSFERAGNVPNSPSSFGLYTKGKAVAKVDDHTVRIATPAPYPLMVNEVATIAIVSKKRAEGASTEDYNAGRAAIGTGPFRLVEFKSGEHTLLEANVDYWGTKPIWRKVALKPIVSGPSRVAALLAGDVDLIEEAPTTDIEFLKKDPKISVSQGLSNRVIYLHMDHQNDNSPAVTDKSGKALAKNPLKDLRVRKAISKAINRDAIVARVMEGVAVPAGQFLAEGFFGHSPDPRLAPEKYDPEGAKKLLADAGYPSGFAMTIHGPSGRYINDAKILEAIAPMLSRVGIETKVEVYPFNVFISRATKLEFSFFLVGWGSGTGEVSSPLRSLVGTYDKDFGRGASNRGRYSNPALDKLLDEALATIDDGKREKLLQQAVELSILDLGIIPLHYQVNSWAAKKGLRYAVRTDEATLAMSVERQ
ncbi:MAG: ABC transporter substrate-binding protein [Alphaproteobacteria bacterium]|nr:ABC transporter substrate-binding protein [Alphaproteobacteria bacterium]